jgi:hypothetical protein
VGILAVAVLALAVGAIVLVATSGGSRSPAVDLRGVDWENASVPARSAVVRVPSDFTKASRSSALAVGRMTGRATRQRKCQARLRSGPTAMRWSWLFVALMARACCITGGLGLA